MAACTLPAIFGLQKWFDARFEDLCYEHDAAYTTRIWKYKVEGDFQLALGFAKKGYPILAFLSIFYTGIFGSIYWLWRKYI